MLSLFFHVIAYFCLGAGAFPPLERICWICSFLSPSLGACQSRDCLTALLVGSLSCTSLTTLDVGLVMVVCGSSRESTACTSIWHRLTSSTALHLPSCMVLLLPGFFTVITVQLSLDFMLPAPRLLHLPVFFPGLQSMTIFLTVLQLCSTMFVCLLTPGGLFQSTRFVCLRQDAGNKVEREGASSVAQQLHFSLLALRSSRAGCAHGIRRAVSAMGPLRRFFDEGLWTCQDFVGLAQKVSSLAHQLSLDLLLEKANFSSLAASGCPLLWRKVAAHRAWNRRVSGFSISQPDSSPCGTVENGVDALRSHWELVFAEKQLGRAAANKLLAFARVVPPDYRWVLSFEDFCSSVEKMEDSATVPNGVPYSGWLRRLPTGADPLPGLRLLYAAYRHLLLGASPPVDFNHSFMVFPPKGQFAEDAIQVCRLPQDCRPLNLSNTDNNIISRALDSSLHGVASHTAHGAQRGFIRGRLPLDGPLSLELAATKFLMQGSPSACLAALDSKAAFASVIREWLWMVLLAMGVHPFFIRALQLLHFCCSVSIIFGGRSLRGFTMLSGIKQGCPSGPRLFVLSLDPFLWYLASRLQPAIGCIAVIADDVALALRNLVTGLRITLDAFAILELGAGILLNIGKCEVASLFVAAQFQKQRLLHEVGPLASSFKFVSCIKNMGSFIGPGADSAIWSKPVQKFLLCIGDIRSMRLGFLRSIALYKSLAFSVLLHVGQFYPPDRDTLQAEHRALQLLTAAPWHTWPDALLYQLRSIGINSEARSLVVSCGSASYRLACSSRVLQEGSLDLDTLASSSDCVLFLALPEWRIAASFGHLLASLARATRLAPSLAFFDRKKFEELFRQRPNVIAILLRRAIVATGAPFLAAHRDVVLRRLCYIAKAGAGYLVVAVLQGLLNGWPTSSCFDHPRACCKLGCGSEAGDACPTTCAALRYQLSLRLWACEFRAGGLHRFQDTHSSSSVNMTTRRCWLWQLVTMLFFVLFTWLVNGDALSLGMPFCLRCLAGFVRRPEGLFGYAELSLAYSLWYWWHFLYSVVLDAVLERVISLRGGFFASYIRYLASLPGLRRECYVVDYGASCCCWVLRYIWLRFPACEGNATTGLWVLTWLGFYWYSPWLRGPASEGSAFLLFLATLVSGHAVGL